MSCTNIWYLLSSQMLRQTPPLELGGQQRCSRKLMNTNTYATYAILLDPFKRRVRRKIYFVLNIQVAVHMQSAP